MKNKYCNRSHISETKFRLILQCFAKDFDSYSIAEISGVSRQSIQKYFEKLRRRILEWVANEKLFSGEVEVDESYFGARRVRGKRGRGAAGKTPVFGILKRKGKVFVNIVKNCTKAELMPIIEGRVLEGSTIYSYGWRSYDGLILNGYNHYRVYHSKDEFVRGKAHVNGIESFWSFTKRRLSKFNGLTDGMFNLHLKESEWRWNNRGKIYDILLKEFRKNPL